MLRTTRSGAPSAPGGHDGDGRDAAAGVFHHQDEAYARWRADHPEGYVLNLRTGDPPALHRATCRSLRPVGTTRQRSPTGVPKVCSTDRSDLEAWARAAGRSIALCGNCGA
jgi:hypothetical protein